MRRSGLICWSAALLVMAAHCSGSARNPRRPNSVLATHPKLLLMDSKVTLEVDPASGLLKVLSILGDKTGLNFVTCLEDRKPESAEKLKFNETSISEVMDRVATIYRVQWRLLASESGQGQFILWEPRSFADSRLRWDRLKEEIAREAKEQGWYVPKTRTEAITKGISQPLNASFHENLRQFLPSLDSRFDAVTWDGLSASGIPFLQLPGDVQSSFLRMGEQDDQLRSR